MQSAESSGGNLRPSTSCPGPFSEPAVLKQPQFTLDKEPTLLCNQVRTKKAHQATVRVSRQHSLHCLGKTTQPLRPPGLSAPERLDSIVSALVPWVPTLGESEGTMESATVMQAKANLDRAV